MRQVYRLLLGCAIVTGCWSVQGCLTENGGTSEGPGVVHDTVFIYKDKPETPSQNPPQNGDSSTTAGRRTLSLALYGDSAKSWQSRFIKDAAEIPVNAFKAFYFDDSVETTTADTERVAFPVLDYAYTGPSGIPAQRFNAYWIGRFEFAEDATWRIDLSQSWSIARILVDGSELYSGQQSQSLLCAFSKGSHILEIEYKNDWHTIGFSVLFAPVGADKPADAIDTSLTGAEYWYAGAYESGKSDLGVDVVLEKSAKPVILFLGSYEVVRWNIMPADSNQVIAVFVDSYEPQSTVTGLRASVPVTTRKGMPWTYKLLPQCYPQTGYCEENGFEKLVSFLAREFHIALTGFTGAYDPASMTLPELPLDSAKYREIEAQTKALVESSRLRGLADVFPGDTAVTWQKHFVANDSAIPSGRFRAYYFSDGKPDTVVFSELAAAPAMKYSWSDFRHLDANDFAGYWVGRFDFTAPTILDFAIDQSHAQTAIFVATQPVSADPAATTGSFALSAGTHLIEIQHINNWHTIDFAVSITPR